MECASAILGSIKIKNMLAQLGMATWILLRRQIFFLIPKIIEILDTNQKEAGLKRKWEAHNEIINILKNWKNGRKLKKNKVLF